MPSKRSTRTSARRARTSYSNAPAFREPSNNPPALVRRGGVVSLVGVPNRPAQIQAAEWLVKEVRLTTSLAYLREEFEIAQGLVADGRIRCAALHTSTVSLQQLDDAFARLSDAPQEVKVLVDPRM